MAANKAVLRNQNTIFHTDSDQTLLRSELRTLRVRHCGCSEKLK